MLIRGCVRTRCCLFLFSHFSIYFVLSEVGLKLSTSWYKIVQFLNPQKARFYSHFHNKITNTVTITPNNQVNKKREDYVNKNQQISRVATKATSKTMIRIILLWIAIWCTLGKKQLDIHICQNDTLKAM